MAENIAPLKVHIVAIAKKDRNCNKADEPANSVDALLDDRDERPGVIADAELMGAVADNDR